MKMANLEDTFLRETKVVEVACILYKKQGDRGHSCDTVLEGMQVRMSMSRLLSFEQNTFVDIHPRCFCVNDFKREGRSEKYVKGEEQEKDNFYAVLNEHIEVDEFYLALI